MNTKTSNNSWLYRTIAVFMIVVLMLAAMPVTPAYAAGCNSTGSGNWNTAGTWSCGHVPIATTDTATILNGHNVTVNAAATTNQVTINSGGTVTIAAGVIWTISNGAGTDLIINGTLVRNGTLTLVGSTMRVGATGVYNHAVNNAALPVATWSTGSLLLVTGITNTALAGLNQSFSDITWNCPNQTIPDVRFNEMTTAVRNLNIINTGTGSIRNTSTTSGPVTVTVSGNYTQTGGKFNLSMGGNVGTLNVAGNFSQTGGILTEESTVTGAVVFNGAVPQTYTSGGTVLNTINYTVNTGATLLTGTSLVGDGSNGTFTLALGGTLGIGNPAGITTAGATGNIRVTGARTYNAGANYTYNGAAAQATGNGLPATVNNLTINNAAGVTMTNATTTVNGALNLTNGILTTSAGNTLAVAGNITGGSATSYVNGPLARAFTAVGAKAFPVGKSGVYRPATFNYTTNPGARTVTVELIEAAFPGSFGGITPLNRYWNIFQTGANGPSFLVTLDGTGLPGGTVAMLKKDGATTTSNATGAPNYTNTVAFNTLSAPTNFTLGVLNVAPTITSAAPSNGTQGVAYSHTYTATGAAPITFSVTAGALPTGLNLTSAGVLSGTPTAIGLYTGTVTAANGTAPDATQNFSITINEVPAITSPNNASFTLGAAGTFTVTATGSPAPTLSMTGALPAGLSFTPATGILAGTPAAGTGGSYPLTFTASNGVSPDAIQNFTLTVTEGPSFTSANNTSFSLGLPGTFTATAVGSPAPTLSMVGTLPSGVTFTPATGILAGTPAAGTVGSYPLTFTATNGILPDATQSFTLTVKNGPSVAPSGINSVPDTGNGSITNNESIVNTLGITKLIVKFDQDVYDDPTDTTDYAKDVTNPANYMLVLGSSTGVFQTVSCLGGVVAPDVAITVDSVAYSNGGGTGPFVATLNINSGFPLNSNGFYRLYVCGTTSIVDAANINLKLAGNGTTPGTDFLLSFRIQARGAVGGGGNANNNNNNVAASSVSSSAALIPASGFAPNKVTVLPAQPADKAYMSLGEIRIEIPSLGINYPIVGVMFDKSNWDLTWLKDSVAYLEGSAYPTLAGNTVLTAHVRDANKNLGPFSDIKGMQSGQKIYIHANGQIYIYQVQENTTILPSNISAAFKHEEYSWITLVTCEDYNAKTGVYTHRRMVRAVLVSVVSEK